MEISLIVWLIICGVVIVMGFGLGINYLSEWKEGLIESARIDAQKNNDKSYNAGELAKYKVQAKISLPVWLISFILAFVFLAIVAYTLLTNI